MPILLGEAGEAEDAWNRDYHRLNERYGFGWSFWTYKNLESSASVVNVTAPKGWTRIAAAGSMADPSLEKAGLTRAEAKAILWDYLDAIRLARTQVNVCYIRSLDLGADLPDSPCPRPAKWP